MKHKILPKISSKVKSMKSKYLLRMSRCQDETCMLPTQHAKTAVTIKLNCLVPKIQIKKGFGKTELYFSLDF